MTNDYLRCSKDVEYCRDWYLEKNKGTWNQTIVKESTPSWVVKDMVDLLPEDSFALDAKFIDIFSKSGIFLEVIRNKLMRNQAHIDKFPDPKERFNYITRNQLYALVWCDGVEDVVENQLALTTVAIYGRLVDNPNVYRVEIDRKTLKKEEGVHKFIELFYSEEYFKGMKFDVVIGNPPYNNDIYLKFVTIGHGLANKHSLWITPAKWQAKGGKDNEAFRKDIVTHMSKIVYYKDSTDVFGIEEWGGISYYMVDNYNHDVRLVKNCCNKNNQFVSDYEPHDESRTVLSPLSIRRIIDKIALCTDGYKKLSESTHFSRFTYTHEQERGHAYVNGELNIPIIQGTKSTGGYLKRSELKTMVNLEKYKVITSCMWGNGNATFDASGKLFGVTNMSIVEPYAVPKGSFVILRYFDTEEQCKSFISYMYSKLSAFLIYMGLCGATLNSEFWRFVPDPQDWSVIYEDKPLPDHEPDKNGIYTDEQNRKHCSLYKKYNLTDDEIAIIESVIKERK